MSIKIIIADDHKLVSTSLIPLLNSQAGMQVIAEVGSGGKAVELAATLKPDIVVMDIGMAELNGIEATRQIVSKHPRIKIIILTMHADRRYITEALKAGASGYLTKGCSFEELVTAIRTVSDNKKYLSPEISEVIIQNSLSSSRDGQATVSPVLTKREREVLQLLAEGKTIKEIAFKCNVSIKTIYTHREKVMQKLKIDSIAGVIKYAIQSGLVSIHE
jgi:DNA-binding NarL/FixJ family response regulator